MEELTTTSYAILCQLALKPWSAYELAEQKVRYFQYMWPRAQSGIYREIKHLAELGYAQQERSRVGKRQRTVYAITSQGLEALRAWLATPVARFSMECEATLRLFVASFGTKEQVLTTLEQVQAEAEEMLRFLHDIMHEYLEGRAPFQEQVYVRVLANDLFLEYLLTMRDWAKRTRQEIMQWQDLSPDGKNERALELVQRLADRSVLK